MGILKACVLFLRAMLVPKARLAIENLALRQQLAVCKQSVKRPKLRPRDRIFWVCLSRLWSHWRSALVIVQPETVILAPQDSHGKGDWHICGGGLGGLNKYRVWRPRVRHARHRICGDRAMSPCDA